MKPATHPPLTDEQRDLVATHLPFVRFVLRASPSRRGKWGDDFQAGVLGLIRAVQGWEPSKGKLVTYAKPWIKDYIFRRRHGDQLIHISHYQRHASARKVTTANRYGALAAAACLSFPLDAALDAAAQTPFDADEWAETAAKAEAAAAAISEAHRVAWLAFVAGESMNAVMRRTGLTRPSAVSLTREAVAAAREAVADELAA